MSDEAGDHFTLFFQVREQGVLGLCADKASHLKDYHHVCIFKSGTSADIEELDEFLV